VNAVVLAAGFATRLWPLTLDRAKPLLEVGGRPVLSHLLDRVLELRAVERVVVVTNARFHAKFEAWRKDYISRAPIELVCDGAQSEAEKRGALADLELALESVPAGQDVLVVAGDNLIDTDLAPFARAFARAGEALVTCREVAGAVPPGRYGEVTLDARGRLVRLREKPPDPRTNLAAICLYVFRPAVRARLAEYLGSGGDHDAPGHFLAWLAPRAEVTGFVLKGRYFDIGNRESLEAARAAFGS